MKKLCALIGAASFMLGGCDGRTTAEYAGAGPKLDIRDYLNGELVAKGILFDYWGSASLMFNVRMTGSWQGNTGILKEHFTYSDGRSEDRTWSITFSDGNNFTAKAADVVGEAIGTQHGNALNMRYKLNAKRANGDTILLSMDDWMYLIDEKTLINRTKLRKFGLAVGELVISFEKL